MLNIKTLIAAALLSGFAAVSFAQAPAVAAPKTTDATATAPADAASMPKHKAKKKVVKKHTAKKAHKAKAAASTAQ